MLSGPTSNIPLHSVANVERVIREPAPGMAAARPASSCHSPQQAVPPAPPQPSERSCWSRLVNWVKNMWSASGPAPQPASMTFCHRHRVDVRILEDIEEEIRTHCNRVVDDPVVFRRYVSRQPQVRDGNALRFLTARAVSLLEEHVHDGLDDAQRRSLALSLVKSGIGGNVHFLDVMEEDDLLFLRNSVFDGRVSPICWDSRAAINNHVNHAIDEALMRRAASADVGGFVAAYARAFQLALRASLARGLPGLLSALDKASDPALQLHVPGGLQDHLSFATKLQCRAQAAREALASFSSSDQMKLAVLFDREAAYHLGLALHSIAYSKPIGEGPSYNNDVVRLRNCADDLFVLRAAIMNSSDSSRTPGHAYRLADAEIFSIVFLELGIRVIHDGHTWTLEAASAAR